MLTREDAERRAAEVREAAMRSTARHKEYVAALRASAIEPDLHNKLNGLIGALIIEQEAIDLLGIAKKSILELHRAQKEKCRLDGMRMAAEQTARSEQNRREKRERHEAYSDTFMSVCYEILGKDRLQEISTEAHRRVDAKKSKQ